MSDSRLIASMQGIQWQKAKGELLAYLETFWHECDSRGHNIDNGYELARDKIEAFIEDFEGWCR